MTAEVTTRFLGYQANYAEAVKADVEKTEHKAKEMMAAKQQFPGKGGENSSVGAQKGALARQQTVKQQYNDKSAQKGKVV